MDFWGLEVESNQVVDVKIGEGTYVEVTQACHDGKTKESCMVHIIVNGKKLLIANLDPEDNPTAFLNVALVKDVKISHTLTDGSVYLTGSQFPMRQADLLLS